MDQIILYAYFSAILKTNIPEHYLEVLKYDGYLEGN